MTREPIYAALFALVSGLAEFKTRSRKLKHWSDVPANQRPALFMAQSNETAMPPAIPGLPTRWLLAVDIYVYVSTKGAAAPGPVLNPILDAISAALEAQAGQPQTLGGLAEWTRIEGTIQTSEGTLGDDEVAIIPVRILAAH